MNESSTSLSEERSQINLDLVSPQQENELHTPCSGRISCSRSCAVQLGSKTWPFCADFGGSHRCKGNRINGTDSQRPMSCVKFLFSVWERSQFYSRFFEMTDRLSLR